MAKRQIQFTQEQIEILFKNPYVESINSNTIKFTSEFKELALKKDSEGITASKIFKDAGFDLKVLGKNIPTTCLGNWRYKARHAHIIPYFRDYKLKDIMVTDIENFRKVMQNKQISERRIKNILTLMNQIIKYFQNNGYIDKTCVFEVKRIADIPKRQIQILTPEQLVQLFKILKNKYPYMLPIVQNLITLKQPLNTILTGNEKADGQNEVSPVSEQIELTARMCKKRNSVSTKLFQDSEQQKKSSKRKIRKDFYKIKQELGLTNYLFDDLRFRNIIDN